MSPKPSSPGKSDVVRGNGVSLAGQAPSHARGHSPAFGQARSSLTPMEALKEAWSLVKESRALWWAGILAGLGQGYGMNAQISYGLNAGDVIAFGQTVRLLTPTDSVLLLILALFVLALWVFSMMAEAGLMESVLAYKDGRHISFRSTLAAGKPRLWPLIKFSVVVMIFSLFFILLIGMPSAVVIASSAVGLVTGSLGVALILAYGILLALLYPWMTRFVVLENKSVFEAIRSAWKLFRSQPGVLVRLGIGGLLAQVTGVVLIVLILVTVLVPLLILAILIFQTSPENVLWPVLLGILAVGLFLAGILTALKNAYYTLAFRGVVER